MTSAPADARPRGRLRPWHRLGARLLVSGGLLALLLVILPWEEVATAASRMTLPLYLGALAGFLAAHALGAVKWRMLMAASGRSSRLGPVDTVGCYGAGLLSNLFLPSVVGGDVVRAGLAVRTIGRPEAVILGSMADRLVDFSALGLLILAGAAFAGAEIRGWTGPAIGILVVVGMGAGALSLPLLTRRPLARWPRRIRRRVGRVLVALRHLARSPGTTARALAISLGMQSALIMLGAWLGRAVGAQAPLWAWFLAWPLAKAAGMLPVTLGGLGVRDAALATLLLPFGVPAALGLVASLAWNTVLIGGALFGGVLWWIIRPGRRIAPTEDGLPPRPAARRPT
jgi:uncharacterized membrane protein YbhN (UPF0104 family)